MAIRESLLNTITSVASSDFVRLVTSAGASSKATVANLFKSFESGLGAKSSLTTSDYIRVVGSDNNLYKQSVSAVATTMGIDVLNNFFTKASVGTTGTTFNLPNNYRGTMYIYDSSVSNNGMYMVYATASGAVNYKAVSTASNITLTDATNKLTVTPTSGSKVVLFINAQGTATV